MLYKIGVEVVVYNRLNSLFYYYRRLLVYLGIFIRSLNAIA
jgi:hypothetical protein